MAIFLTNEINATERDTTSQTEQVQIGPLQLGSRDPNSPQNILYYGL